MYGTERKRQQQQQQSQPNVAPFPPPGVQPSSAISQQPPYSTVQESGAGYQQQTEIPGPLPQGSSNLQYPDQSQGGQSDYGFGQTIQPTRFTNQFVPVTPDSGSYTPESQTVPPDSGFYNSANAGYQSPQSNFYSTGDNNFNTASPQFPILNPATTSYNNENAGNREDYGQASGQYYNEGNTAIPNQSAMPQNEWTTTPNYPYPGGVPQIQPSTTANYIAPQVWDGGMYSSSSGSSSPPPNFVGQEQNNQGYEFPNSAGLPQNGATSLATPSNDYVINNWQSTTPSSQWMPEAPYSNIDPSQNQGATPGDSSINRQFEQSTTPPGSQYYVTSYPPASVTPPPSMATSAMWPQGDITQGYQSTQESTQGYQTTQGFISTTEASRMTTTNYDDGQSSGLPASATTKYGQNASGIYVQAPPQQESSTQNVAASASYRPMSDESQTATQGPLSPTMGTGVTPTQSAGSGPKYDFQHNMNTVYGNYESWPSATRQLNDASFTSSPELSSSASSMAFAILTVTIAVFL
ncbi:unnamed protein product [Strongylus vulgaris]|uniref:Uncharacterized protein n=1 Tax=Strongylus vulgaris TaxID=40348 RepID=A0A3P7IPE8_STRVU|nr:unnamed protein product [Strongylus vulgaris]